MTNSDYPDFEYLFNEKLRERGLTLKRLSELSNIATSHLESLRSGDFGSLPPAPYVRGYLRRLGSLLGFDPEVWWERLKAGNLVKVSGEGDELPRNRFAKRSRTRLFWVGGGILIVLLYLGTQFPRILGEPVIHITYPDEPILAVRESEIVIYGTVKNADSLSVNDESVLISADGSWKRTLTLHPGLNTIQILGKKFLGRETRASRQVLFEPLPASASSTNNF
ncbi:helix-turn-helix domain-containing protein [Candidatus Parcubacteria bacterium]|nr:MAG: helix-turn-helix domain-containing protein [Candidatus Parcubacteria bacterium]